MSEFRHQESRASYSLILDSKEYVGAASRFRPSLVQHFVGRTDILGALEQTHITERSNNLRTPPISVVTGIGGSGKTQIALKFAKDQ